MSKYLFPFWASVLYWLRKEDRYSLQSPFVANLYKDLLAYIRDNNSGDRDIETWRKNLLKDKEIIHIEDFGAGSKKLKKDPSRSTQAVTRYSTSNKKFSLLYQFFCLQSPSNTVIELGTCVGLNSLYLSKVTKSKLYTFEGSKGLIKKAKEGPGSEKIEYIEGDIGETLPEVLRQLGHIDFILMDANHTYEGTRSYFNLIFPYLHEQSVVAIGDIHWSPEMEKAWEEISQIADVSLSMDFFECGILYFRKGLSKNHYTLTI
ncbi:MAG: O-methyltransferase [Cecembia sp.]